MKNVESCAYLLFSSNTDPSNVHLFAGYPLVMLLWLMFVKEALPWRLCCMLAKTAQIFDKEPLEIALKTPGRKYEMISLKNSKL